MTLKTLQEVKCTIDLSIIIVTYNSERDICRCLDSIEETRGHLLVEVLVVDSASHDNTVALVRRVHRDVVVLTNETNVGFPVANNQAIIRASGRYIMLLNPDTIVCPGALEAIVSFMDRNRDCGVCGPMLADGQGNVSSSALPELTLGGLTADVLGFHGVRRRLSARAVRVVSGACLTFRPTLVQDIGLLDEKLFWCEEPDFCLRARRRGYRIDAVKDACVVHFGFHSAKTNLGFVLQRQYMSSLGFFRKHGSIRQFRCVCVVLLAQVVARYLKWRAILVISPSGEAQERVAAFGQLLRCIAQLCIHPRKYDALEFARG